MGVTDGLKNLYKKQLKPAEDVSLFNEFHGAKMDISADFDSVPMVLVIILNFLLLEFFFIGCLNKIRFFITSYIKVDNFG